MPDITVLDPMWFLDYANISGLLFPDFDGFLFAFWAISLTERIFVHFLGHLFDEQVGSV